MPSRRSARSPSPVGATLDLNKLNQSIGSLAGAGSLTLGSAGALQEAPYHKTTSTHALYCSDATMLKRVVAYAFSKRPWHNVSYFPGLLRDDRGHRQE